MKLTLCLVATLVAYACCTNMPPCFAEQTTYSFNYQEFHDVSRQLEDVVVYRSLHYTDYQKTTLAVTGDFISGGTSFIGAVYITPTMQYVWIHGGCTKVAGNYTDVFTRCLGLQPFRNTTFANLPGAVYRLVLPSTNGQTQHSAWYWFTNPQQPIAWQSYYTAADGTEVGTMSYIIDGYQTSVDPSKLAIPAVCTNAVESEVVNPLAQKVARSVLKMVSPMKEKY